MRRALAIALVVAACNKPGPTPTGHPEARSAEGPPTNTAQGVLRAFGPQDDSGATTPTPTPSDASTRRVRPPLSGADAEAALFPDAPGQASMRLTSCPGDAPDRTMCLIDLRYRDDAHARGIAHDLYEKYGILVGTEKDHYEDMSWRGKIHIVPEAPTGKYQKHLEWLASAAKEFDDLFAALDPEHTASVRYEWHPFTLRYFRSVGRTTPSAYAAFDTWMIAYNVVGSLNTSEEGVHELFFHELFHRNDGDDHHWSARVLAPIFRSITSKCGTKLACLTPYTPTLTTVRGGTYYAFQPEDYDPVHEYGAELAIRWYREHRAITRKLPKVAPFKCGPKENAEAWKLIVDEFFGGIDRVPACGG